MVSSAVRGADAERLGVLRNVLPGSELGTSLVGGNVFSVANLDLYDLDLDLWQYSLDRKKII